MKKRLLRMVKRLKLERSIFIKSFNKNIFKYIRNSEGVLLSSKWEGMPNILLQSLHLNKPVLSTDCKSGPKELKKLGYNVKLAPVNDTLEYANQLKLLSKTKVNLKKNIILNKNILILITKVSIDYFNNNMKIRILKWVSLVLDMLVCH